MLYRSFFIILYFVFYRYEHMFKDSDKFDLNKVYEVKEE